MGEALACPDSAEWGKFSHTLHDIKANKAGGGAGGIAGLDDETGLSSELFFNSAFYLYSVMQPGQESVQS